MDNNIRLKNVVPKNLTDQQIQNPNSVWGLDFVFYESNRYQVTAESGSGKSTLIKIINGIFNDYSGLVSIGTQEITNSQIDKLIQTRRNNIHTVYQDLKLFDNLSVWENIVLPSNDSDSLELAKKLVEKFKIQHIKQSVVSKVSHGQKQRVAIIRALLGNYKWILLDEPFSHLDAEISDIVYEEIIKLCELKKAGIIITSLDERFKKMDFEQIEI